MGSWHQEEPWRARKLIVAVRRPRQPAGENFWAREGRVLDGKWCSCDGRGRLRAAWAMGRVAHASDGAHRERSANLFFRFVTRLSVVEMEPTRSVHESRAQQSAQQRTRHSPLATPLSRRVPRTRLLTSAQQLQGLRSGCTLSVLSSLARGNAHARHRPHTTNRSTKTSAVRRRDRRPCTATPHGSAITRALSCGAYGSPPTSRCTHSAHACLSHRATRARSICPPSQRGRAPAALASLSSTNSHRFDHIMPWHPPMPSSKSPVASALPSVHHASSCLFHDRLRLRPGGGSPPHPRLTPR